MSKIEEKGRWDCRAIYGPAKTAVLFDTPFPPFIKDLSFYDSNFIHKRLSFSIFNTDYFFLFSVHSTFSLFLNSRAQLLKQQSFVDGGSSLKNIWCMTRVPTVLNEIHCTVERDHNLFGRIMISVSHTCHHGSLLAQERLYIFHWSFI
jgi:hypothetical protein